jgi:hypothetical protein
MPPRNRGKRLTRRIARLGACSGSCQTTKVAHRLTNAALEQGQADRSQTTLATKARLVDQNSIAARGANTRPRPV